MQMLMRDPGRLVSQSMMAVGIGFIAIIVGREVSATPQTTQEIRGLLDFVEHSECRFVRNGTEYSGPRARAHLMQKLDYLEGRKMVKSAEDFIDLAATKSSMSGRIYEVRCPEGAEPASIWLKRELQRQRQ
ncbi:MULTISPECIES: DUF5329 domain-containing protein [Pseudomonas]|uniref:DUF5329 domain-containing protein n=1 Tax=Pseudomonas TaxID=286 RepID=UPI00111BE4C0|nr:MULTISPECIES: DUF5329 domain-containing protein [Pseudomonas]